MGLPSCIPIYQYKSYYVSFPEWEECGYGDYIGLMCPHCYCYVIVRADNRQRIYHIDGSRHPDAKPGQIELGTGKPVPDFKILPSRSYHWVCPECGVDLDQVDHIDPNIVPIISLLNKKGYETEFCCEGHEDVMTSDYSHVSEEDLNEIDYSFPYIKFIDPKLRWITDRVPLLGPWSRDESSSNYDLYVGADPIPIHVSEKPEDHFTIHVTKARLQKTELMGSLLLWAYYLPDVIQLDNLKEDVEPALEELKPVHEWLHANTDKLQEIYKYFYTTSLAAPEKDIVDIARLPFIYMMKYYQPWFKNGEAIIHSWKPFNCPYKGV